MTVIIEPGFVGDYFPLSHPRIGYASHAGTVAASTSAAGFGASLATARETYNAWKPTAVPATWDVTYATPARVGYVGIGAHTIGSSGATIKVQRRISAAWVDVPGSQITPANDDALMWLIAPVLCDGIRLVLTGAVAELGVVLAGPVLEWPRLSNFVGMPISEAGQIQYQNSIGRTGEFFARTIRADGLEFDLTIEHLPEAFRATEWAAFRQHLDRAGATFFVAPKPFRYPDDVAYAWPSETARFERTQPNYRISGEVSIRCRGYKRA
jgi:hypothetical protein